MKKLLMSLVAVALMSSAAFAKTGEIKPAEKMVEKTKVYTAVAEKSNVKVVGEVKENKEGNFRTLCRLTMSIYNTSGQLIDTQVLTYTCYGATDMFYSNCGEYFSATIQNYQNYYGNPNHN